MASVLRYTALWLGLVALAFVNGAVREMVYTDALGVTLAHHLSVFTLIALIFFYTWLANKKWPIGGRLAAVAIGLVWLVLSVLAEGFIVVALMGRPIEEAIAQYDVLSGSLWALVPVAVLFIPLLVTALSGNAVHDEDEAGLRR